ncbi:MAG: hypothetical protein M3466_05585 [Gemmatimonadota bacterium]|nr:hypothetical protein [Gemmatimonadota bacterium]
MRYFTTADNIRWLIEARMPSASNVMVVFHYPTGRTARLDRYAWHNSPRPEARDVTARLDPTHVLESLTDADLALLFRRSMLISAGDTPLESQTTNAA